MVREAELLPNSEAVDDQGGHCHDHDAIRPYGPTMAFSSSAADRRL
jgi:hypothetical protein